MRNTYLALVSLCEGALPAVVVPLTFSVSVAHIHTARAFTMKALVPRTVMTVTVRLYMCTQIRASHRRVVPRGDVNAEQTRARPRFLGPMMVLHPVRPQFCSVLFVYSALFCSVLFSFVKSFSVRFYDRIPDELAGSCVMRDSPLAGYKMWGEAHMILALAATSSAFAAPPPPPSPPSCKHVPIRFNCN